MNTNGFLRKHWFHVALHFAGDSFLFIASFIAAINLRFGNDASPVLSSFLPFVLLGACVLSSVIYIAGLYSTHSAKEGLFKRSLILAGCLGFGIGLIIAVTYLNNARPVGRGIVLIGAGASYLLLILHHGWLLYALRNNRERVAYVVSCSFDEAETRLFQSFGGQHLEFSGLILHGTYAPKSGNRVLGQTSDLAQIVVKEGISRVLCSAKSLKDEALCKLFCQLRYSGVTVLPLISLCEEVDQFVPLELVTSDWLLNASGEPHMLYIKKLKRLLDIVVSALMLALSSPILLLGVLAVKFTSAGPILYRQTRMGRFGKPFTIFKLRTMCVDAEKDGAVWCGGHNDPRITPVGKWLRRYRIDEIPQLLNVFRGNMSFVGPRPERPEIVEELARQIPFFQERQMVQPGITGWAQVNYPYGASVEDAARKLEYDLYYMKHMSLFLDVFILLDTVRTVLSGGVVKDLSRRDSRVEAVLEWRKLNLEEPVAETDFSMAAGR